MLVRYTLNTDLKDVGCAISAIASLLLLRVHWATSQSLVPTEQLHYHNLQDRHPYGFSCSHRWRFRNHYFLIGATALVKDQTVFGFRNFVISINCGFIWTINFGVILMYYCYFIWTINLSVLYFENKKNYLAMEEENKKKKKKKKKMLGNSRRKEEEEEYLKKKKMIGRV